MGQLRAAWVQPHAEALERGDKFYADPETGLMVMTEHAHNSRGKCCGSGCRHCPFAHERVPLARRAALIKQPAWLVQPDWGTQIRCDDVVGQEQDTGSRASAPTDSARVHGFRGSTGTPFQVIVLFWSTGKDSFLAYRALLRAAAGKQTPQDPPVPV
jgi:hypothetical protein